MAGLIGSEFSVFSGKSGLAVDYRIVKEDNSSFEAEVIFAPASMEDTIHKSSTFSKKTFKAGFCSNGDYVETTCDLLREVYP